MTDSSSPEHVGLGRFGWLAALGSVRRITRKIVLALADAADALPAPPDSPAYQQILAVFADAWQPLRARDLCQALDIGLLPKNIDGMRAKLKRLVGRRILAETEPGLFTQHRP